MIVDNATSLYVVEFTTDQIIAGVWQHSTTGAYRAWNRNQPSVWSNGDAIQLQAELPPDSIANLAVRVDGIVLTLDALEITSDANKLANPFHHAA